MQSGEPLQQAQNPFRSPRDPIRLPLAIPAFKIAKHRIYTVNGQVFGFYNSL
jgi:hypothetical protein